MTDFTSRIKRLAQQPHVFNELTRGVERETLRYNSDGSLATSSHPESLGSALTNNWITTDYSESLLEFITPVSNNIDTLIAQLKDVHHFTQSQLESEQLWPLSMPCYVESEDSIPLAQYGSSNIGKMKTLYREGLKRRYGSLMQIISGVHFNFSFPESYWDALYGEEDVKQREQTKSSGYFALIRNYYRLGWLIPYFFGASPAICSSFIRGRETKLPFESVGKTLYLPYATSLRLSDLGYTNSAQSALRIGFNSLDQYLDGLNQAIQAPSQEFAEIGVKVDGEYRQLNSNILQIENELYAPIRPKRVGQNGERPSESLARAGVEYIEVRSLDVNPYSPIGIDTDQIRFLDLFLAWASITDSPTMTDGDLSCWRDNWNKVITEGRKPGLMLQKGCGGEKLTLVEWSEQIFGELEQLAELFDSQHPGTPYQDVCARLKTWLHNPELTVSGRVLKDTINQGGLGKFGLSLGTEYRNHHLQHQYQEYSQQIMEHEVQRSRQQQEEIEQSDTLSFDNFLESYFSYLN